MSAPEVVTLLGEEAAGDKVATSTFSLSHTQKRGGGSFPRGGFRKALT